MSIPDRKDFIIGDRESRIVSLREWTQNNKAAGRRLVVELSLCHQKILERAKGFEPSTPTLASLDILLTFINDAERFCAEKADFHWFSAVLPSHSFTRPHASQQRFCVTPAAEKPLP